MEFEDLIYEIRNGVAWIIINRPDERTVGVNLTNRILGRNAAEDIVDPETGEIMVGSNEEIDETAVARIEALKLPHVRVRSPLTCESRYGLCGHRIGAGLEGMPVDMLWGAMLEPLAEDFIKKLGGAGEGAAAGR